jgi:hypothetical protein
MMPVRCHPVPCGLKGFGKRLSFKEMFLHEYTKEEAKKITRVELLAGGKQACKIKLINLN